VSTLTDWLANHLNLHQAFSLAGCRKFLATSIAEQIILRDLQLQRTIIRSPFWSSAAEKAKEGTYE
jgi:hypothetical protein